MVLNDPRANKLQPSHAEICLHLCTEAAAHVGLKIIFCCLQSLHYDKP